MVEKGPSTSWEKVHDWYDDIVGAEGHYYHQHVILPHLLPLIASSKSLLDIGCGQGVLARHLPKSARYVGIDSSPSLIAIARKLCPQATFFVQDALQPFSLKDKDFSHAVMILALQNMADPIPVFENAARHLAPQGKLVLVLNHPCFRIPRQSSWAIDEKKQMQSRRIDRYMTPMEIPILTRPSQQEDSTSSVSYHLPLSSYSLALGKAGFCIERLDEWCSDKTSHGKAARRENRARKEFPLFLCIVACKTTHLLSSQTPKKSG